MDRRTLMIGALAGAAATPALAKAPSGKSGGAPSGFAATWAEAERAFHADLEADKVVGGSLWFLHEGRVLGEAYHGYADLQAGRKVDARTIYHWASITKTFTAIGLMQLRDRGLVSLSDPAVKYLPELREVHDPFGRIEEVTLERLIGHSSGLRDPTFPWRDKNWQPDSPPDWATVAAMMPYTEIEFAPGSRYSYSNPGLSIIGRVIEEVTGDHYESYIDKNILKPLGMSESYFDVTPWFLRPHRSNNYFTDGDKPVANGPEVDTGATVANGGLNTPLTDFARYTSFLLGIGDNGTYDTVLSRASLEQMWRPRFPTDDVEPPQFTEQMGLSFFLVDIKRPKGVTRYIGHTGSQAGFRSFFYVEPKSWTAVVWVVNSRTQENFRPMVRRQRLELFNTLFPLFTERAA
jgi:CubicO group peptidase (beta-lactamase class C family)